MRIKAEDIKILREKTKLGMTTIKKALIDAGGDIDVALKYLNSMYESQIHKMTDAFLTEGCLWSYVHNTGKLAVLVEINCETDFAARTDEFKEFCERVAIQIAGANPKYVSRQDIPHDAIQPSILNVTYAGSPKYQSVEEIKKAGLENWYSEICLLEQKCIELPTDKTIEYCRAELSAKLGEKVLIRRFVRWEISR